jgi:hypothetical protein
MFLEVSKVAGLRCDYGKESTGAKVATHSHFRLNSWVCRFSRYRKLFQLRDRGVRSHTESGVRAAAFFVFLAWAARTRIVAAHVVSY